MVWQPNILNNCYELSGGCAPRTTHHGLCPWTPLGDFRSQTPVPPPPNPGYATDMNKIERVYREAPRVPGVGAKCSDQRVRMCVCLSVCPRVYLKDYTSKFHLWSDPGTDDSTVGNESVPIQY